MKTFLLSMTILFACITVSQSAYVPYLSWRNDPLNELEENDYFESQEQGPSPSPLNCFQCAASNEQDCIAMQSINQCTDTDFVCITVSLTTASSSNFTKSCAAPELCDLICPALNESGSAQSCVANCCNTSECNAGSPTTVPPMTTEMTPTTDESSTTTMAPTTTAAPMPTTALVCGGVLNTTRGSFTSPNFPNNYPNNANCTWTITLPTRTLLWLAFPILQLEPRRDFVKVFDGGRRVSSRRWRGKRSFDAERVFNSRSLHGDEGESPYDTDELDYNDNDNSDNYYDDNYVTHYEDDGDDEDVAVSDDDYDYNNDGDDVTVGDDNYEDNDDYDDDDDDVAVGVDNYDEYTDDDEDVVAADDDYNDNSDGVLGAEVSDLPENSQSLAEANEPRWWRPRRGRPRPRSRPRPRPRPRPRLRRVFRIRGVGQEVRIVFTSDGSGTRRGFLARFRVLRRRGTAI